MLFTLVKRALWVFSLVGPVNLLFAKLQEDYAAGRGNWRQNLQVFAVIFLYTLLWLIMLYGTLANLLGLEKVKVVKVWRAQVNLTGFNVAKINYSFLGAMKNTSAAASTL
jgi:hypothetical protein